MSFVTMPTARVGTRFYAMKKGVRDKNAYAITHLVDNQVWAKNSLDTTGFWPIEAWETMTGLKLDATLLATMTFSPPAPPAPPKEKPAKPGKTAKPAKATPAPKPPKAEKAPKPAKATPVAAPEPEPEPEQQAIHPDYEALITGRNEHGICLYEDSKGRFMVFGGEKEYYEVNGEDEPEPEPEPVVELTPAAAEPEEPGLTAEQTEAWRAEVMAGAYPDEAERRAIARANLKTINDDDLSAIKVLAMKEHQQRSVAGETETQLADLRLFIVEMSHEQLIRRNGIPEQPAPAPALPPGAHVETHAGIEFVFAPLVPAAPPAAPAEPVLQDGDEPIFPPYRHLYIGHNDKGTALYAGENHNGEPVNPRYNRFYVAKGNGASIYQDKYSAGAASWKTRAECLVNDPISPGHAQNYVGHNKNGQPLYVNESDARYLIEGSFAATEAVAIDITKSGVFARPTRACNDMTGGKYMTREEWLPEPPPTAGITDETAKHFAAHEYIGHNNAGQALYRDQTTGKRYLHVWVSDDDPHHRYDEQIVRIVNPNGVIEYRTVRERCDQAFLTRRELSQPIPPSNPQLALPRFRSVHTNAKVREMQARRKELEANIQTALKQMDERAAYAYADNGKQLAQLAEAIEIRTLEIDAIINELNGRRANSAPPNAFATQRLIEEKATWLPPARNTTPPATAGASTFQH